MRGGKNEQSWQVAPPEGWRTSYRRRSLANWLTDTEHGAGHLLARVMANRLWQHHLGRGIVNTPNDFGLQGELPTHPQLLDWLALELIENGWRLKPLHKQIVMSATYRQSAAHDAAKFKADPQNKLHWRRTPARLEAEVIRKCLSRTETQVQSLPPSSFGPPRRLTVRRGAAVLILRVPGVQGRLPAVRLALFHRWC